MICYTVITNDYDELKEPFVSEGWRYIVFSDRFIESEHWECYITDKHNRDIKIRPHKELFHEPCLYVDGSIEIIGNLNEFITEVPTWFSIWKHPHRDCVYDEADAVVRLKGCHPGLVKQQMARYDIPKHWGLGANGIMLRDLSDSKVRQICERWWKEYQNGVERDQLSLMPVFHKMGYKPDLFGNDIMNKYFKWGKHEKVRHN